MLDAEQTLAAALDELRRAADAIARGPGGREVALAITKAQEAQHWLRAARELIAAPEGR